MVFSAAQLIRRDGVGATGMRDVAEHASAPRGSLQHYFPGGKEQLVDEAVAWAGGYAADRVGRFVAALPEPTPSGLFAAMVRQWTDEYASEGFAGGCPVAAATVDRAGATGAAREAVAAAFTRWTDAVAAALVEMGVPRARAASLSTVMISALEGAILLARAERDVRPLTAVARELGPLLDAAAGPPEAEGDGNRARRGTGTSGAEGTRLTPAAVPGDSGERAPAGREAGDDDPG
ncbi:TetR/AcrR family transcriptional regulator [Streptomyces sp. enrichment culture]|uniref:TetR/AcrR family transcriptional regulator n=1 Tax=Streptomyces sp. enrichment culture TaxID=1795815 RepID=UPI003F5516CC